MLVLSRGYECALGRASRARRVRESEEHPPEQPFGMSLGDRVARALARLEGEAERRREGGVGLVRCAEVFLHLEDVEVRFGGGERILLGLGAGERARQMRQSRVQFARLTFDGRERHVRFDRRIECHGVFEQGLGCRQVAGSRFDRSHRESQACGTRLDARPPLGSARERKQGLGGRVDATGGGAVVGLVLSHDRLEDESQRAAQDRCVRPGDRGIGEDQRRRFGKSHLDEQRGERDGDVRHRRIEAIGFDRGAEESGLQQVRVDREIGVGVGPGRPGAVFALGVPEPGEELSPCSCVAAVSGVIQPIVERGRRDLARRRALDVGERARGVAVAQMNRGERFGARPESAKRFERIFALGAGRAHLAIFVHPERVVDPLHGGLARAAHGFGCRLDERAQRLNALHVAEGFEARAAAGVAQPRLQRLQVLFVVAFRRRTRRHQGVLHREECDGAPLVASRRHEGKSGREGLLSAVDHFHPELAGPHQEKGAAQARETALLLPRGKALSRVHQLAGHDPGQQTQAFGRRLAIAEQTVHGRPEGLVGNRRR